jgi:hypothetical protein
MQRSASAIFGLLGAKVSGIAATRLWLNTHKDKARMIIVEVGSHIFPRMKGFMSIGEIVR